MPSRFSTGHRSEGSGWGRPAAASTTSSRCGSDKVVLERRDALLERVASLVEIIDVLQLIRASRDPKDDKFLEAAVNGRADVIVTGDRDRCLPGSRNLEFCGSV